ncbi:MAG TPA: hypothetical protein DCX07_15290 [Phycisphaerales bacterium]|nr:hypothetical protein [Phycisphaerales bacterium]
MTIVPASALSRADLHRLGNNVLPVVLRDSPRGRSTDLDAVNRSLSVHGEAVAKWFPRWRLARKEARRTTA